MPASPSSKINATSLPNITALREELDYGNPHLTRCSVFYDDVRGFRKKFITSIGLPGPDLHNWKLKEHHMGLDEMTTAYLDRDGNGPLFWPDSSSEANYNKLQYSRDRQRIKRLMKYLFFRLNQQQFRNKRYKNKDKQESVDPQPRGQSIDDPTKTSGQSSRDGPQSAGQSLDSPKTGGQSIDGPQPEGQSIGDPNTRGQSIGDPNTRGQSIDDPKTRGQSRDDPIDVDALITHPIDIPISLSSRPIHSTEPANDPKDVNSPAQNQLQTVKIEDQDDGDPYMFRYTPEVETNVAAKASQSRQTHKRKSKPLTPDQAAKRAKPQSRSPKRRNNPPPDTYTSPSTARRSSDRPRKPVVKEGFHSIEELNEIFDRPNSEEPPQLPFSPLKQTSEALTDEPVIRTFATILGSSISGEATQPSAESEIRRNDPEHLSGTTISHRDISVTEHTPQISTERKYPQEEATHPPLITAQPIAKISLNHSSNEKASVLATRPLEKPSETGERSETPRSQVSAKPNISFIYRFVLSRSPIYSYRSWNPSRKLEETSLGQMIEELGLTADVRGLIFTVEGPNFRAVEEILRENETGFSVFVRQIKRAIRALLSSGWGIGTPLIFEMDIEPIRGDTTRRDEEFDDDFTI